MDGGAVGCFMWLIRLLGIGVLVVVVVVGINLISPAVDPCPEDSPGIPPPGLLLAVFDVFLDECVSVAGEVVSHEVGQLVVEVDRGEYVQWVRVRGPADVFERFSVGERVRVAGRIGEHEDGGYVVHHGVDRGVVGQSTGEPSGGRSHALDPHNRPNPSPPDDALRVPPRCPAVRCHIEDVEGSADSAERLRGAQKVRHRLVDRRQFRARNILSPGSIQFLAFHQQGLVAEVKPVCLLRGKCKSPTPASK